MLSTDPPDGPNSRDSVDGRRTAALHGANRFEIEQPAHQRQVGTQRDDFRWAGRPASARDLMDNVVI